MRVKIKIKKATISVLILNQIAMATMMTTTVCRFWNPMSHSEKVTTMTMMMKMKSLDTIQSVNSNLHGGRIRKTTHAVEVVVTQTNSSLCLNLAIIWRQLNSSHRFLRRTASLSAQIVVSLRLHSMPSALLRFDCCITSLLGFKATSTRRNYCRVNLNKNIYDIFFHKKVCFFVCISCFFDCQCFLVHGMCRVLS